jgi:hypothetical protein
LELVRCILTADGFLSDVIAGFQKEVNSAYHRQSEEGH